MTAKQDEIALMTLKELRALRDEFADFKTDMTEDLKDIKFRLQWIESIADPATQPHERRAIRLECERLLIGLDLTLPNLAGTPDN
jgi:hypothetical protein